MTVIIFPKPLEIEIFFPDLQRCKIFSSITDIFLRAGIFFPRYFLARFVSLVINLQDVFF